MKAPISTHILDTSAGHPAVGVRVDLFRADVSNEFLASGATDDDGRVAEWDHEFELIAGSYMLCFEVTDYFRTQGKSSFYADVQIKFRVDAVDEHYHVPLLLNPFGYSTYRGS
jgi:5-hydroxyisourate hydrolase